tara:strand:- start:760 stop:1044 length:285 start_codon:yes stop_codon:yes gene_type:complete
MNNEMVSSCCGSSYEDEVRQCGHCGSLEIAEHFRGDEGWTICEGCETIEGSENEVNLCEKCDEVCEIEDESEYNKRQIENNIENKADAKRKYNE